MDQAGREQSVVPKVAQILREGKLGPSSWVRASCLALKAGWASSRDISFIRRGFWATTVALVAGLGTVFVFLARETTAPRLMVAAGAQVVHALVALAFVYAHLALIRDRDEKLHDSFGIANALTVLRLVYIPTLVSLIVLLPDSPGLATVTLVLYVLTAASDCLDGFLARTLHRTSDFGRMYDPICDILFNPAVVVALWVAGALPWWLAALVVVRYAVALLGGVAAYVFRGPFRVEPTIVGKLTGFVLAVVAGFAALKLCMEPAWLSEGLMFGLYITVGVLATANTSYLLYLGVRYRSQYSKDDAIF